jgi:hypothetical protein
VVKVLQFFRIVDKGKPVDISITNVACWVVIVKIAFVDHASAVDLGTLLVALSNYAHKRHINSGDNE